MFSQTGTESIIQEYIRGQGQGPGRPSRDQVKSVWDV